MNYEKYSKIYINLPKTQIYFWLGAGSGLLELNNNGIAPRIPVHIVYCAGVITPQDMWND